MIIIIVYTTFFVYVSSFTLITKEVIVISKEDKNIILNCTYQNITEEIISDKNIRWTVREKNVFKDVATFSRPGGVSTFYYTLHGGSLHKQDRAHRTNNLTTARSDDYKVPCV